MKLKRYEMFVDELGNLASMPDPKGLYCNADEAEKRISELERQRDEAREALRPFAAQAEAAGHSKECDCFYCRARKALEGK